jgi:hypothetical protein
LLQMMSLLYLVRNMAFDSDMVKYAELDGRLSEALL